MALRKVHLFKSLMGKFIGSFLVIALLPMIAVSAVAIFRSTNTIQAEAENKLVAVSALSVQSIETYFQMQMNQLHVAKDNIYVHEAVTALDNAFMEAGDTIETEKWWSLAEKYDPVFKDMQNDFGWEDIFLMCSEGSIVYTTNKGEELGLFVTEEPLKSSPVGVAFSKLADNPDEDIAFSDIMQYAPSGNEPAGFMVARMVDDDGQLIGHVGFRLSIDKINTILQSNAGMGETGDAFMVGSDYLLRSDSRFATGSSVLAQEINTLSTQKALAGETGFETIENHLGEQVLSAYQPLNILDVEWAILAEITTNEAYAPAKILLRQMLFVIALGALVVAGLGISLARSIIRPIKVLSQGAEDLSVGDLLSDDIDINEIDKTLARRDELGDIARSFRKLTIYLEEMSGAARKITKGDLTAQVNPRGKKDQLGNAIQKMLENLQDLIGILADNAMNMGHASSQLAIASEQAGMATNQISSTIQQVAQGTAQQAQSISDTANNVDQMAGAINGVAQGAQEQAIAVTQSSQITAKIASIIQQVVENARAVTEDANAAAQIAASGGSTMQKNLQGMGKIKDIVGTSAQKVQDMGERSEKIGMIVKTIDDIASQTNLLALNAAIEAARAGEHGKGFSVVADEVRKLAERTATATKEISALIDEVLTTVSEAVVAMEDSAKEVDLGVRNAMNAGKSLDEILKAVEDVTKQVKEISAATEKMTLSSDELVEAVDAVSAVVEENTAATEEMTAGSDEVSRAIENIASVSEENSAATEEVSAATEEMSAQVQEVAASAASIAEMSQKLMLVVNQFNLGTDVGFIKQVELFKQAHLQWVDRIEAMLQHKVTYADDAAGNEHDCVLGKWYFGMGKESCSHLAAYTSLAHPHAELHRIVGDSIQAYNRGDRTYAEKQSMKIILLSNEIVDLLEKLERAYCGFDAEENQQASQTQQVQQTGEPVLAKTNGHHR